MKERIFSYDNCRFFVPPTRGGQESGGEGWARITAKGRREYLPGIDPARSALIVVDLCRGCVEEWPKMIARYDGKLAALFVERMQNVTVPNVERLLALFRDKGMPVIYLTMGPNPIISRIAPREGELVLSKFSSGAYATSALDNVLREYDVATTFFTGTDTCGCVAATMTAAYDKGSQTILVEDACCSSRPDTHAAAVTIWQYKGFVRSTDQVIADYPWQSWVDPALRDG